MNLFRCSASLLFLMMCFLGCSKAEDRSATDAAYAQKFILDATNLLLSWDVLYPKKPYSHQHFADELRTIYTARTNRMWSVVSLSVSSEQEDLKGIVIISKVTIEAQGLWIVSKVNANGRAEAFLTSESPPKSAFNKLYEVSL